MSDRSAIEWTDATWNPVRGCTKVSPGCKHCLHPDTPILYADMTWRRIGDVKPGDVLAGFDEWPRGRYRCTQPSVVENVWWHRERVLRLISRNSEVRTTDEHRWLRTTHSAWIPTSRLRPGRKLRQIGWAQPRELIDDYRAGYIAGITLGDGTFRYEPGQRSDKLGFPQAYWRVALADPEPLERLTSYLATFGVEARIRPFHAGSRTRKPMQKVEVRSLSRLATLRDLVLKEHPTADWARGWLAGMFDAEGSHERNLRISQKDVSVLQRLRAYGSRLGLRFEIEQFTPAIATARLAGDLTDRFRFFTECRPSIARKSAALWGRVLETHDDQVVAIETAGADDMVDIQTSTRTFFAAGLATHNCYAETFAERFRGVAGHPFEQGFDLRLVPGKLADPLRWRSPRRIFVNSMSDLFQEGVPVEYIEEVGRVMQKADWHTYQVLTKRHQRMCALLSGELRWLGELRHVWLGVSVENRRHGIPRIAALRATPAAVRFLSIEPLLEDLGPLDLSGIDWVIVGGESGQRARPMQEKWVLSLRD